VAHHQGVQQLYEAIACVRAVKSSMCKRPVHSASIHHHRDGDDDDENIMLYRQKFSNSQFGYSGKL
jgi:hypothetical protein